MNEEVLENLVLLLIYLTSWREKAYDEVFVLRSWKGYDFNIIDALMKKGYINGSSKAKSVFLTDEGKKIAEKLEQTLLPKIKATLAEMRT